MKWFKKISIMSVVIVAFVLPTSIQAADFNWSVDLNLQSRANPSQYASQLDARFRLGEPRIQGIMRMVQEPADAYLILRFAEMSSRSPEYVMEKYRAHRNQGWGSIAQSLNIKPGSADFKALKTKHDMYDDRGGRDSRDNRDNHDRNDHDRNDNHNQNDNGNNHKKDRN